MKIAVTYEGGSIFQHFGKTETFKMYEVEDGKITSMQIVHAGGAGHSALAGFLSEQSANVLICGGIGEGAQEALKEAGIKVISGAAGEVDAAVNAYLAGELESAGTNCDHHHEEGHSCCGQHEETATEETSAEEEHSCGGHCSGCSGCGGAHVPDFEGPNVGKTCRTHYRGTFDDGTQFDSSYDRGEPLEFVCGAGQMIHGYDKAVATMEVGQTINIHLMPEEAYGMPDPRAIFTLEIAQYPWNPTVKKKARRVFMLRWLFVILDAAAIFFLTYQKLTTNVWGLTAFLCQLLAVIELAFGLQFVEAGWSRKISSRMPLDEHYEYALYMYHIQSVRDLATNNRMLLLIASLEIQLGKYDHATQTITQISVEKCTPVQLKQLYYMQILLAAEVGDTDTKNQFLTRYTGIPDTNGEYPSEAELTTWIEADEMDRLISALKNFTPTRKEHILRTCLITIVLAYSTFFYGAWYGINKSAGYAIRYYFAEISTICVSVTLSCLLIWGMICLYKKQKSLLNRKAARRIIAVSYAALTLFLLSLIGYSFLIVSFGVEGTETVTGQDQHYIYLSVQPDYGIATQYRTDNLIYMQKTGLFLPNTDTLTESSVPDSDPNDSETQDSSTTDSTENSPAQESQNTSPLQDEMRAVYQYIQQQNPLPDMNFTYTANAKGENYAILSETTEEKNGTTVNVNYCLYDNGSKTDENNNTFEELVLEKVYPDGGYETELVDFYLVNPETLEVIDEQKSSW